MHRSSWIGLFLVLGLASCTTFEGSSANDGVPQGGQGGTSGSSGEGGGAGEAGLGGATNKGNACSLASDCDDKNPCTQDACTNGFCKQTAVPSGTSCSDGDRCNGEETCDGQGACAKGAPPTVDDGNECTKDECDPATGNVSHKGLDGCKPCEQDQDCNDGNACVIGQCSSNKCIFFNQPQGALCDDGNKCTDSDRCDGAGKCTSSLKNIDDGNPCTKDECAPATGDISHQASFGQICDDGDPCSLDDQCDAKGACVGFQLSIDDGDDCTDDLCDPITGNVEHKGKSGCGVCTIDADCDDKNPCTKDVCSEGLCGFPFAPPETTCDDGNKCTTSDQCDGAGKCVGTPKSVDDGNPCTKDECDPSTGNAKNSPVVGASCDDGNACSSSDVCDAQGLCKGIQKSVDDGNECTADSCDSETGNVSHSPLAGCKSCMLDKDCNDNNACTEDSCVNGKCAYANAAAGSTCDDGNKCTTGDKCDGAGKCGGSLKKCAAPPGPCYQTIGSCNPTDGLCNYPVKINGTTCDDGNVCTLNDTCESGVCGGLPKVCNTPPDEFCYETSGTCNTTTGACSYTTKPNGTLCNDYDTCTIKDKCYSGLCEGIPADPKTICEIQ